MIKLLITMQLKNYETEIKSNHKPLKKILNNLIFELI
jgi:hypothetical protein